MNQELVSASDQAPFAGRPGLPIAANAGAVSIEMARAIAETRGQIMVAKDCPRDLNSAFEELMMAARYSSMAEVAFYKVPRAGGSVTGPSIRAAEEFARAIGNIEYGHRELSRGDGKSEVEVFAWDKEKNTRRIRQLTVMHVIDTRNGPKPVRDEKEVDDLISNKASKHLRACILPLIPVHIREAFYSECKKTLAGDNGGQTIAQRVLAMQNAFSGLGVTVKMLADYLGHELSATTVDELVDMTGIFNAIREGAKPSEFFGRKDEDPAEEAAALNAAGKAEGQKGAKTATRPQDKPQEPEKPATEAKEPEKVEKPPEQPKEPAPEGETKAQPETAAKPGEAVF